MLFTDTCLFVCLCVCLKKIYLGCWLGCGGGGGCGCGVWGVGGGGLRLRLRDKNQTGLGGGIVSVTPWTEWFPWWQISELIGTLRTPSGRYDQKGRLVFDLFCRMCRRNEHDCRLDCFIPFPIDVRFFDRIAGGWHLWAIDFCDLWV